MIEGNINQNSEFFFNSLLNNFDYNVQKLPNVDDSKTRTVSSKKRNRNLYQQQSDFNLP